MIKIIFFAKYREIFGAPSLEMAASSPLTVKELMQQLQGLYPAKTGFLTDQKVIISVNQELASPIRLLNDGDTVAFYPPVTGG